MKKCTRAKYAVKKPSRNSKFSTKPLHGLLSKMNENLDILKWTNKYKRHIFRNSVTSDPIVNSGYLQKTVKSSKLRVARARFYPNQSKHCTGEEERAHWLLSVIFFSAKTNF